MGMRMFNAGRNNHCTEATKKKETEKNHTTNNFQFPIYVLY